MKSTPSETRSRIRKAFEELHTAGKAGVVPGEFKTWRRRVRERIEDLRELRGSQTSKDRFDLEEVGKGHSALGPKALLLRKRLDLTEEALDGIRRDLSALMDGRMAEGDSGAYQFRMSLQGWIVEVRVLQAEIRMALLEARLSEQARVR